MRYDGCPERRRDRGGRLAHVALDDHVELARRTTEHHVAHRPADQPQARRVLGQGEQGAPGLMAGQLLYGQERIGRGGRHHWSRFDAHVHSAGMCSRTGMPAAARYARASPTVYWP